MNVSVRLFAGLAEAANCTELSLTVPDTATVADVRNAALVALPELRQLLAPCLLAVNRQYASNQSLPITAADELALIPPVSGGNPQPLSACLVTDQPLDPALATAYLTDAGRGGIVLFCGTVREWTGAIRSLHLDYEAYDEMAVEQMRHIASEVSQEWPETALLQWHRVGRLWPKDIAVICGASAVHRAEAFLAAQRLIDRLKKEVPIWKKETYANGDVSWQATP